MKQRLDIDMVRRGLVRSRSEAENWIRLGKVRVNGHEATRPGQFVDSSFDIKLDAKERYVSRAGLKLASVASRFRVSFDNAMVLDVGSSTGGFTDYALQHGASKVYAIDVGTDQLHPSLRSDVRVELHEKTDILEVRSSMFKYSDDRNSTITIPSSDIVVIDVSFTSLRTLLPHIATLVKKDGDILAMVKPQFEAGKNQVNKGVIKNDSVRRDILREFETWAKQYFVIVDKADSEVHGSKGNRERFYHLTIAK